MVPAWFLRIEVRPVGALFVGVNCLLALGCGSRDIGGDDRCPIGEVACNTGCIVEIDATLESVHAEVLEQSCAAIAQCHRGLALAAEGLAFETVAMARANLIDQPSAQDPTRDLVEPGNPDNSYLMNKLDGVNLANITQRDAPSMPMPLGGKLCEPRLEAVRDWIASGAP